MTKGQQAALAKLKEVGFVEHAMFPYCARNRPYWALVEQGIAEFESGPRGSWIKTQGFMLVEGPPHYHTETSNAK